MRNQILLAILLFIMTTIGKSAKAESKQDNIGEPVQELNDIIDVSLGLGLNAPEIIPIEVMVSFNQTLAVKAFYAPSLPFNVRVEYSRGTLTSNESTSIENPDLDIDFSGSYGPHWGVEVAHYPFKGSWYWAAGWSERTVTLSGDVESQLIINSAAGSFYSNSIISIKGSAASRQSMLRLTTGWQYQVFNKGFFGIYCGLTAPVGGSSSVKMVANVLNPSAVEQSSSEVLDQAKQEFEDSLESQSMSDVDKLKELRTPILGISIGYYL